MEIFSPEQELRNILFEEKKVQVSIKRDDMIHPFISGNKWRKLKYNISKAKSLNKNTLITFGGAWSNHLLATACAAAQHGFKSIAYVRGDEVENTVLSMCKLFGMELIFTDRTTYKDKSSLFEKHPNNANGYFINEGGAGFEAVLGCKELVLELNQYYDHIFCAAGTGSTAAGIAQGIYDQNLDTILNIIPVLKGGSFIEEEIQNLQVSTAQTILHLDYHFGGYAKTKPELLKFIQKFISETGIMIEPTYTGKALYALFDLISKDYFPKGSKILFVHTGGLTGLLGMLDKFKTIV